MNHTKQVYQKFPTLDYRFSPLFKYLFIVKVDIHKGDISYIHQYLWFCCGHMRDYTYSPS